MERTNEPDDGTALADEVERKNAAMAHQQELADRTSAEHESLGRRDKTVADSFPASDPPATP